MKRNLEIETGLKILKFRNVHRNSPEMKLVSFNLQHLNKCYNSEPAKSKKNNKSLWFSSASIFPRPAPPTARDSTPRYLHQYFPDRPHQLPETLPHGTSIWCTAFHEFARFRIRAFASLPLFPLFESGRPKTAYASSPSLPLLFETGNPKMAFDSLPLLFETGCPKT